jgi:hypothetical protein
MVSTIANAIIEGKTETESSYDQTEFEQQYAEIGAEAEPTGAGV